MKRSKAEIKSIYRQHQVNYGYRRITLALHQRGFKVNHKKFSALR